MLPQITLSIVGIEFPNKSGPTRRFAVDLLLPGDPIELRPEPKNPVDPQAIAVMSVEGVQMGYLPAERAPYVGTQMRRGEVRAVFQGLVRGRAFARIAFDGETPVLPPAPVPVLADPEWWPDEIWPDD